MSFRRKKKIELSTCDSSDSDEDSNDSIGDMEFPEYVS